MTRAVKIATNVAAGLVILILVAVLAIVITVRTSWFHNFVREKIIAAVEDSIGGRVELGAFDFNEGHLRAGITDLVVHGYEPPGSTPFLRVHRAAAEIRFFTRLNQIVSISRLDVDRPEVSIIVLPDGRS